MEREGAKTSNLITLYHLPRGRAGVVHSLNMEGIVRRRILDLGLVPGTRVEAVRTSPLGDPRAFRVRGAVIAFRREEGSQILVEAGEE